MLLWGRPTFKQTVMLLCAQCSDGSLGANKELQKAVRGLGVGEMRERGQKVQYSSSKINKSWGHNGQHGILTELRRKLFVHFCRYKKEFEKI